MNTPPSPSPRRLTKRRLTKSRVAALLAALVAVAVFLILREQFSWRTRTLEIVRPGYGKSAIRANDDTPKSVLAFSPDGDYLACLDLTIEQLALRRYPGDAPGATVPASSGSYYALAFSPDGKWLAYFDQDQVHLWAVVGGALHKQWQRPFVPTLSGLLFSHERLCFSPDSSLLAVCGANYPQSKPTHGTPQLAVWAVPGGALLWQSREPGLGPLAFAADSTSLIVANERPQRLGYMWQGPRTLLRLDARTGRTLARAPFEPIVEFIACAPQGGTLVLLYTTNYFASTNIKRFHATTLRPLSGGAQYTVDELYTRLLFNRAGDRLVAYNLDQPQVYSYPALRNIPLPSQGVRIGGEELAFWPDQHHLATAARTTRGHRVSVQRID